MNSSFVRISSSCSVLETPIEFDFVILGGGHPHKSQYLVFRGKRLHYMVSKSKKRLFYLDQMIDMNSSFVQIIPVVKC